MVFGVARFRDVDELFKTLSRRFSVLGRACTRLGLSAFESFHCAADWDKVRDGWEGHFVVVAYIRRNNGSTDRRFVNDRLIFPALHSDAVQ